mgnify:CR=1 FL=1
MDSKYFQVYDREYSRYKHILIQLPLQYLLPSQVSLQELKVSKASYTLDGILKNEQEFLAQDFSLSINTSFLYLRFYRYIQVL